MGQRYVIPLVGRSVAPVETLIGLINDITGWCSRVELTWTGKAVDFDLRLARGERQRAVGAEQAQCLAGPYENTMRRDDDELFGAGALRGTPPTCRSRR